MDDIEELGNMHFLFLKKEKGKTGMVVTRVEHILWDVYVN